MMFTKNSRGTRWRRSVGRSMTGVFLFLALLMALPADVFAAPRSGGSFGGRSFRGGGGVSSTPRSGYGRGYGYGAGRPSIFFFPSFGWGGFGYGGGGFGFGSLLVLGVLGVGAFSLVRAVRRQRDTGSWGWGQGAPDDDDGDVVLDRAYVYRMQVALGRSARGIQDRMARFASEGDTSTESGLANLLQQTTLELMREKDSIRAVAAESAGPLSFTNAETKMNGLALTERSRFQVERIRGAGGQVRRSDAVAEEGKEALEFVVVTLIVATRSLLGKWKKLEDSEDLRTDLDTYLGQLGAATGSGILGLEVIWTPADPNDSLTETDLMTTYPDLRSL